MLSLVLQQVGGENPLAKVPSTQEYLPGVSISQHEQSGRGQDQGALAWSGASSWVMGEGVGR